MAMVSSKSFCAIAFGRQLLATLPRKTPRTIGPPGTGLLTFFWIRLPSIRSEETARFHLSMAVNAFVIGGGCALYFMAVWYFCTCFTCTTFSIKVHRFTDAKVRFLAISLAVFCSISAITVLNFHVRRTCSFWIDFSIAYSIRTSCRIHVTSIAIFTT